MSDRYDRDRNDRKEGSSPRRYQKRDEGGRGRKKKFAYDGSQEEDVSMYEYGKPSNNQEGEEVKKKKVKRMKPNYNLSGKLSEAARTTVDGVVLKFSEPRDASEPNELWRLFPFKGEESLPAILLEKRRFFLIGRDKSITNIHLEHPSISKQHSVIQFRRVEIEDEENMKVIQVIKPYIMDLESSNGTLLNGEKIQGSRYYELKAKDIIKFGFSSREFVVIRENEK